MNLPPGYDTDTVLKIETNLDDLTPEVTGFIVGKLLDAGALDAWLTPIQMKKNRPAVMLSALCGEEALDRVTDLIFKETTTFGVRVEEVNRVKLERRFESVETEYGEVVIKLGIRGSATITVAPEFESCRAVSEKSGRPLREIYDAARRKWSERPGSEAR